MQLFKGVVACQLMHPIHPPPASVFRSSATTTTTAPIKHATLPWRPFSPSSACEFLFLYAPLSDVLESGMEEARVPSDGQYAQWHADGQAVLAVPDHDRGPDYCLPCHARWTYQTVA
jgi:hypothetical protein